MPDKQNKSERERKNESKKKQYDNSGKYSQKHIRAKESLLHSKSNEQNQKQNTN